MNESTASLVHNYPGTADGSKIDGNWMKVLEVANHSPELTISRNDLDEIARNYPKQAQKASVGVEEDWDGAAPHGQVSEVRRDGNKLMGKMSGIDPRIEDLHRAGVFKKTGVTLNKTPAGLSLARVGLMTNGGHTTLDQMHKNHFAAQNITFAGSGPKGAYVAIEMEVPKMPASEAIARLKDAGEWSSAFDEGGISQIFSALERSSAMVEFGEGPDRRVQHPLQVFAEFLGYIAPVIRFREEHGQSLSRDAALHIEARRLVRDQGISYGQALTQANEERVYGARSGQFMESARRNLFSGVDLDQAARKLARDRKVTYAEALAEVAAERPDLTLPRRD